MSFKEFSILSSGGHFVTRSGTILAILVKDYHFCQIIVKSIYGSRRRCHLNVVFFSIFSYAGILVRGAKRF